jgi:ABC-type antimicrobial peptide transport system permease subunit
MIGGILGTAALIVIITLGHSVERAIGSNLSLLGSASLIKMNVLPEFDSHPKDDTRYFSDSDVESIRKIPGVIAVAASVYSYWPEVLKFDATAEGKDYPNVRIVGVDSSFFMLTESLPLRGGRLIDDSDSAQRRQVCVVGRDVEQILYGKRGSALGKSLSVVGLKFEVVGVLDDADDEGWSETVMVPIAVARKRIPGMYCLKRLTVRPEDLPNVENVNAQILEWFESKHPLWRRSVYYDKERVAAARNILRVFRLFAYVAIFATLILSGVGTATVMTAMIRERTSEIGLKKAMGATDWDIGRQFLFESLGVNFVSCAGGIAFGSLIAATVALYLIESWASQLYILAVTVAVATGAFAGITSGFVPARLASRLDPAVAMRAE